MICIFQFGVGKRSCAVKTVFRGSKTKPHCSIHLSQGIITRHAHILYAGVCTALYAALNIVFNLTDSRRNTGSNRPSTVIRIGKSKINAAGHLDIAVIGPVADIRNAGAAACIIAVGKGRRVINQQGMYAAVNFVHSKAKGNTGICTCTLTVIGYSNAQRCRCFRPFLNRCIFN